MTKSETAQVKKLITANVFGLADAGLLARSMSALIRAARTKVSRDDLMKAAKTMGVASHPEFII